MTARLNPNDRLVVLSDHGFSSFRRAVHLNRWLGDNGYLALREGSDSSHEAFARVDLTRTCAYAVGLSGRTRRRGFGISLWAAILRKPGAPVNSA
jgi:predicted AlkP superfamily phosphohydrolase/phosphomutase